MRKCNIILYIAQVDHVLALQIRVSKSCWELPTDYGGFIFECCPTCNAQITVESYWLVGHENYNFALPSIDQAVSLSSYDR